LIFVGAVGAIGFVEKKLHQTKTAPWEQRTLRIQENELNNILSLYLKIETTNV